MDALRRLHAVAEPVSHQGALHANVRSMHLCPRAVTPKGGSGAARPALLSSLFCRASPRSTPFGGRRCHPSVALWRFFLCTPPLQHRSARAPWTRSQTRRLKTAGWRSTSSTRMGQGPSVTGSFGRCCNVRTHSPTPSAPPHTPPGCCTLGTCLTMPSLQIMPFHPFAELACRALCPCRSAAMGQDPSDEELFDMIAAVDDDGSAEIGTPCAAAHAHGLPTRMRGTARAAAVSSGSRLPSCQTSNHHPYASLPLAHTPRYRCALLQILASFARSSPTRRARPRRRTTRAIRLTPSGRWGGTRTKRGRCRRTSCGP